MITDKSLLWKSAKRYFLISVLIVGAFFYYRAVRAELHRKSFEAVDLTGYQHIGPNFNIAGFYVDGYYGSNVGREGGGGGQMCCVLLPKKWRPGLLVEVRWAIGDWTKENRSEIESGNYKSITYTCFIAHVPVEKYETAETVFVHFFTGGKVRVVSGFPDPGYSGHSLIDDDSHAADIATTGQRVDSIFTDAEMAEMQRKHAERSTFFGDWR
jgi:hypothetical protein